MVARRWRKARPNEKYKGYDSKWEFNLHQDLLRNWAHHDDEKIEYVIEHKYETDFTSTVDGKKILLESKGRFWNSEEYSKYLWIAKVLPKDVELVFLFMKPEAPMPRAKKRKDGTKRSHAEWAESKGFRWFSEDNFPEEWR